MQVLRVLVVDDEAGMRHSVTRALNKQILRLPEVNDELTVKVETASSGEEALVRIETVPPDLLMLDQKLGGMTGIEVLARLSGQPRDFLTVMITAFATIETAVRATKSGAFDFLAKPFTPAELKETVRKAAVHLLFQREARRLAAEKRRVRFEFLSVLAHELKSPLNTVETYISIMNSGTLGDRIGEYGDVLTRCKARIEGMRKLIDDLLDLTRIESGQRQRVLQPVNVVDVARAAMGAIGPLAAERQIAIRLQAEGPVLMTADRGELEIVLNNLLSNAIKYNRDGGSVDVRVRGDDRNVVLEVADTGIGLSASDAERLFNEFVRIHNEQTRAIPGSGLGLSIVRKIAQLYHGSATVRSTPGLGSTFCLTLERADAPAEMHHATA